MCAYCIGASEAAGEHVRDGEVEDRRGKVRLRIKVRDTLVRAVDDCTTSAQQLKMTDRITEWRSTVANVLGVTASQ